MTADWPKTGEIGRFSATRPGADADATRPGADAAATRPGADAAATRPGADADATRPGADASRRQAARASREQRIAQIAARQHGLVTLEQLRDIGLTADACRKRLKAGRLYRVHRAVYAVGHRRMTRERSWMAAVLACGPEAVLSHRSAGALLGLLPPRRQAIDVTTAGRRGRLTKGIRAHCDGSLGERDRTRVRDIPCTTVARTLLDLAAVVPVGELEKAIGEAEVLKALNRRHLRELLSRSRGRRGVARLRKCLTVLDPQTGRTRSELERLFLSICRRAAVPRPKVNCLLQVGDRLLEPDFLWREEGLIVETDGGEAHDTATARARDRRRDQRLMLDGWRVVRFDWSQVIDEPAEVARILCRLLAQPTGLKPDR
jgi:very-short-patch-repair endonuclease